jgi:hypothetical protein
MTASHWRTALIPLICLLVTGCLTTSPEQQAKRNEERCIERGYQPKTDAFADCVVRIDNERADRMDQRHREQVEKSAAPSSNRGY